MSNINKVFDLVTNFKRDIKSKSVRYAIEVLCSRVYYVKIYINNELYSVLLEDNFFVIDIPNTVDVYVAFNYKELLEYIQDLAH